MSNEVMYENSLPVAALVTGVISLVVSPFALVGLGVWTLPLGIVTLVFGLLGLKRVRAGTARREFKGYAITGIVGGAVLTAISAVWAIIFLFVVISAAAAA